MVRFAKERSDKNDDVLGWTRMRAKRLKLSDRFELESSKRLLSFLDLAVQLFVLTCGLEENAPNIVRNNSNSLT